MYVRWRMTAALNTGFYKVVKHSINSASQEGMAAISNRPNWADEQRQPG